MHSSIENALYPRPAVSAAAGAAAASVSGQALTIVGTTTGVFTAFDQFTKQVFFDIQNADVIVTIDGTAPVLGSRGNRLPVGTNYTWSKACAQAARFVSTGTSSFLFCHEIAI